MNKRYAALASLLLALQGCTPMAKLGNVNSYASYNCQRLNAEIEAIEKNQAAYQDAGTPGFMDTALAILTGVAAGKA